MRFFIVDVFTERKYAGNPLGVFVVERALDPAEMQQIAKELHFSNAPSSRATSTSASSRPTWRCRSPDIRPSAPRT